MYIFIIIGCFTSINLISENSISNLPYVHSNYLKDLDTMSEDEILFSELYFNFIMHNIDKASTEFESLNFEELNDKLDLQSSDVSHFRTFVKEYIMVHLNLTNYDKVNDQLIKWKVLIDNSYTTSSEEELFQVMHLYYCYKTNSVDIEELKESLKLTSLFEKYRTKRVEYINQNVQLSMRFTAKIAVEIFNNKTLSLEILDNCLYGYYDLVTVLEIVKLIGIENKYEAITRIDLEIEEFFESHYYNPIQSYSSNLERLIMFKSYLHYKVGELDEALENFYLIVTQQKYGSTFMGDWGYWLDNRNYYEDEYKVMLILKDLYVDNKVPLIDAD